MTQTLKNNAFALNRAIEGSGHCQPGSTIVRDGHHNGTLFTWLGDKWCVVCLEGKELVGFYDRIAVVTLNAADPDDGLNQASLGCDLETPDGEWVVDVDDLDELTETYGDTLEVIWEQEA